MFKRGLLTGLMITGLLCSWASTSRLEPVEGPATVRIPTDSTARIAVMPFFRGKWQPGLEEKKDQTLACSLAQICRVDPNIKADADRIVTELAYDWLAVRFADRLIPYDRSADAFANIQTDSQVDTPRSLAMTMGAALDADLVLAGTVWRFRERRAVESIPDSPAAVSFAVYLIDVKTGQRKWRGIFDVAQSKVTDDLLKAPQQSGLGVRWLTVDELARAGVKRVFKKFPL